jgi:hypothetical protein
MPQVWESHHIYITEHIHTSTEYYVGDDGRIMDGSDGPRVVEYLYVLAVCSNCKHMWKIRGVTQITQLFEYDEDCFE